MSGFPLDGAIYAHPLIPKRDESYTATQEAKFCDNASSIRINCKLNETACSMLKFVKSCGQERNGKFVGMTCFPIKLKMRQHYLTRMMEIYLRVVTLPLLTFGVFKGNI